MFEVALKRAGFAVSCSRTASWEIPTGKMKLSFIYYAYEFYMKAFLNLLQVLSPKNLIITCHAEYSNIKCIATLNVLRH
jgi:hypothetical protein